MTPVHLPAETAVRLQQAGISTGGCIPAAVSQSVLWGGQKKADSVKISKGFNICTCSWEGSLSICEYSVFLSSLFAGAFGAHAIVRVVVCTFVPLGEASQTQGERRLTNFICALYFVCVQVLGFCTGEYACVCCWYLCACKRCDVLGGCCFSQVLPLICYITALSMSCQLGNLATTPECTREKPH